MINRKKYRAGFFVFLMMVAVELSLAKTKSSAVAIEDVLCRKDDINSFVSVFFESELVQKNFARYPLEFAHIVDKGGVEPVRVVGYLSKDEIRDSMFPSFEMRQERSLLI